MSPSRLKEALAAARNGAVAYTAVAYSAVAYSAVACTAVDNGAVAYSAVTYSAVPRNSKRYRFVALNEIARVLVSR